MNKKQKTLLTKYTLISGLASIPSILAMEKFCQHEFSALGFLSAFACIVSLVIFVISLLILLTEHFENLGRANHE